MNGELFIEKDSRNILTEYWIKKQNENINSKYYAKFSS